VYSFKSPIYGSLSRSQSKSFTPSRTSRQAWTKLKPSAPEVESKTVSASRFRTVYANVPISELVLQIGAQFDRQLFDKTGLQGGYDFALEYMPSPPRMVSLPPEEAAEIVKLYPSDDAPTLLVALRQQLGLKVVPSGNPGDRPRGKALAKLVRTEQPMNRSYRCSDTDFSASSPRIGSLYISSCAVLMIMNTHAPNTATFISTGMIL
jgi:Protein of unknown function (DUF3738)